MPNPVAQLGQHVIEAEVARRDLAQFCALVDPLYEAAPHTRLLCEYLEAVERRDIDRLIIQIPPRHSKPLSVETPVLLADGTYRPLGSIEIGDSVVDGSGKAGAVVAVHDQGILPVLRIRTHSGREVIAARDHPFMTPYGWTLAGDSQDRNPHTPEQFLEPQVRRRR